MSTAPTIAQTAIMIKRAYRSDKIHDLVESAGATTIPTIPGLVVAKASVDFQPDQLPEDFVAFTPRHH
ncbi:hypothetical protein AU467_25185 [Mesorhizobium loti]|uniref:Uncharacterized protein n=1 Tax=Rhizobium loti TaxID=381 RepID=A0A101KS05_RHILI|nr:hypothetical protein AU467_25185 [Mesorhizobium loti]